MAKTYKRWRDLKDRTIPKERQEKIREKVEHELLEMDLRAVRELLGKTQVDVADALPMTQSEVSRLERRQDYRVSTLRRFVEALGGELEIIASFGDKKVRLRSAG